MKKLLFLFAALLIFGFAAGEAKATLSYDLSYVINGYTGINPAGFLTVAFSNTTTPGQVQLTITCNLTNPNYFFSQIGFKSQYLS